VSELATGRPLAPVSHAWLPAPLQLPFADVVLFGQYGKGWLSRALARLLRVRSLTVFFASENQIGEENGFADQLVGAAALSLGHRTDVRSATNGAYLRMPYWLPDVLDPNAPPPSLALLPALEGAGGGAAAWRARPRFAALLSSHTGYPRALLFELLTRLGGRVDAPGAAFHNAPWPTNLANQGNTPNEGGGKLAYLRDARFNVCPENSRAKGGGYATEKLPHALLAGCVPVYWGDAVDADASFFNFRRVIVFDGGENASLVVADAVKRLENDAAFRDEWFAQPLLAPTAREWLRNWTDAAVAQWSRAWRGG
jgi:hypothetical protein